MTFHVHDQIDRLRGLGLPPNVDQAEQSAWRRFIPRRMPWKEVAAFEAEVAQLEERHRGVTEERDDVNARLRGAADSDADALADWERGARRGPRPEPTVPQLEADLARCQDELLALSRAIDQVTRDRADFVAKHRSRLIEEASRATEKAHERAMRALDELESARDELVEARRVQLWSQLYPSPEAGREPTWAFLGGGLRRVLEALSVQHHVTVEQVVTALRGDLEWLKDALTVEQRAKLEGSRRATQPEMEQARDQHVAGVAALHRELNQDHRAAELDAIKKREAEFAALKRRRR